MLIFPRDFEAFEVRGEGYDNNNNNTGSGGQRGWEKCDSSSGLGVKETHNTSCCGNYIEQP